MRPLILAAAISAVTVSTAAGQAVRAWQGTLSLPSYDEGPPDVNPPFDLFSPPGRPNYPYTIRDQLTDRRRIKSWRALFIENEYLKCSVLPDLGGHLYGCTDKINGQEVFYANSSIKLSNIAYRGSWAAFGIEFNFPVSHNWMTTSPVDFALTSDSADGSASIWIGNIDRVYGMHWRVRLTLRPGRAVLEQHTTLANYSDVRRRFYWWTNAAVRAFDDTQILYPMKYTASHGFADVDTWPVDRRGTDNSILRNQIYGPVSRFSHGSREGYMAIWRPRTNSGVAHYASPDELPAKKIWSWGVDADAMDWRRALSDDSSAYVEIQAGLFRDQETYAWLQPHDRIEFSEYWLPLRDLGGLTRATPEAAMHMWRPAPDTIEVRINVVQAPTNGAYLALRQLRHSGALLLSSEVVYADPRTTIRRRAAIEPGAGPVHVTMLLPRAPLLHTEGRFDYAPDSSIRLGPQPRQVVTPPDRRGDGEWLTIAEGQEVNGDLSGALGTMRAGLEAFPRSHALLRAAGRLAVSLGRFAEGVDWLDRALAVQHADHEAAYYRGVARFELGDGRGARSDFELSRQFGALQSAADRQLARLESDVRRARDRLYAAFARSPKAERLNEEAWILEPALRPAGSPPVPASAAITTNPTSNLARVLWAGDQLADSALMLHLAADPERLLDVLDAVLRSHIGSARRAVRLIDRVLSIAAARSDLPSDPGTPTVAQHPLVHYYRAHAMYWDHESADSSRDIASRLPVTYVFPHRWMTRTVLAQTLRYRPNDQTARNLLAMMAMQRGEVDSAVAMWQHVRRAGARFPSLHRNLGYALLYLGQRDSARAVFEEGTAAEASSAAVWVGLDSVLALAGADSAARAASLDRFPNRPTMPTALVYRYARLLAGARRFDDAEALFRDRWFARVEGGTNPRGVWLDVRTARALALAESAKCAEALRIVGALARPVAGLYFTNDGMQPFLAREPIAGRIARARSACGARRS